MTDEEVTELHKALRNLTTLESYMINFSGRIGRAAKNWKAWAAEKGRPPATVKKMDMIVKTLAPMTKQAKVIRSTVTKIGTSAAPANLAKFATAKDYRDKVLNKQLTPMEKWHDNCAIVTELMKTLDKPNDYVNEKSNAVDEKVTWTSMTNFIEVYDEMAKDLAAL